METTDKKRLAVAAFTLAGELESALAELSVAGIRQEELCLLARQSAASAISNTEGTERIHGLVNGLCEVVDPDDEDPLVVSAGRKVETILCTAPGRSGIAERLSAWIPERQSRKLELCLNHGAVLLWVCVSGSELDHTVPAILLRHASDAVQIHEIAG